MSKVLNLPDQESLIVQNMDNLINKLKKGTLNPEIKKELFERFVISGDGNPDEMLISTLEINKENFIKAVSEVLDFLHKSCLQESRKYVLLNNLTALKSAIQDDNDKTVLEGTAQELDLPADKRKILKVLDNYIDTLNSKNLTQEQYVEIYNKMGGKNQVSDFKATMEALGEILFKETASHSDVVKGFNLDCDMNQQAQFNDVPKNNWANAAIAKAVDENLLEGYPNHTFKPDANVTRVEALTTIAKGMTCDIDRCKADEILSKYADGNKVPDWARIPVAKSLQNGALKDSPTPNMILPTKDASRADVASMMQTVRVALGYDTNPKTANSVCPACPIDKNALIEQEEIVKIPTLKLSMIDQLTAKSSHVGQYFRANTLEDVTINGTVYPCGSTVTGRVVEVIRPSGCEKGALKLAFTEIKNGDCKTKLPKQILQAQVNKSRNVNPVARLVEMPFTWAGSLIGVVGRTAGGILTNVGNSAENVTNDAGYMLGHAFQGQFGAAARSLGDGVFEAVKAPIDVTRTALSGAMGLFQTTGDEFAYLVDPRGYKISAVNPREHITIAFGCNE